ncbi:MAG: 16S rRNA (guanine(527)-N(7))-methyltransferase RsmG [Lachnospiraceae bacterium]
MRDYLNIFYDGLSKLGISLSDRQIEQFICFYDILTERNKVMNLTAITEPVEIIEKHFLDSLSLVKAIDLSGDKKVIDVGTGAGFPGIPIIISYPQLHITLLDSLNKRIGFINDVIKLLNLKNVETIHGRSEELGKNIKYREQYDLCVSRAVANMSVLSEYCIPFVKKGGKFISYKSGNIENEVENAGNSVYKLGGKLSEIVDFSLTDSTTGEKLGRSLVVIDKIKETPGKYPRRAGLPSREPL